MNQIRFEIPSHGSACPTDLEAVDDVRFTRVWTEAMFQPFVEPEYAVRLTVVGQRFLAVRIDAGSDRARTDWRSDYDSLTYQIIDIPSDIKVSVAEYMKLSGLSYEPFDFLVRSDGSFVGLEINRKETTPGSRTRPR